MSDEIYEKLVYDGAEHVSVAGFSPQHYEHTILVHGLAKAYSMTGWRIGMTAAPEPIAKAIDAIQSHSTSNPTSFAQKGAVAALNGPQDHMRGLAGGICAPPRLRLEEAQQHSRHLLRQCQGRFLSVPQHFRSGPRARWISAPNCLEQEKVAAVPGIAFGADDYMRISYATSMENIKKGLDRLENFVRNR